MTEHPDFLIVCDHGVRGGSLDPVVRFHWLPEHGWQIPFPQFTATKLTPMTGDERTLSHVGEQPTRLHYQIACQARLCVRDKLEYRSPEEKLQALFTAIAGHEELRAGLPRTDGALTLSIPGLQEIRNRLAECGLPV
jgi:hypothetical protein